MITSPRELPDNQLENILLCGVRGLHANASASCAEAPPRYIANLKSRRDSLGQLLACANELLRRQTLLAAVGKPAMDSCGIAADYLRVHFRTHQAEAFVVVFLDAQHRLIAVEELFRGTLTQTSVYPREVVKQALAHNAGAVLLAHNHPSGMPEPSRADEFLTASLKSALALVDVRVLDHFVVAGDTTVSFCERGLL
jgi:DNA repair protein RadC